MASGPKGKRRFKVTTDSKHDLLISPNVLNREFTVAEPDQVWVGDITYIATDEGWLFLAVVIDLFNRQVVGWSLRQDMTRDIVIDALRMAWFKRRPGKQAGLILHSDRGSQGGFNRSMQHLRFKELQWEQQSMAAADEVFAQRWVRLAGPRLVSGKIGSVSGRRSPKG